MYCDKCGSQIPEDTGVCPNCGKSGNINTANADAIGTAHKKNNRPIIIIAVFILIIVALLGCLLVFNVFGNNTSLLSSDKSMWDVLPQIDYTPVEELEYEYDDSLSGIIITRYTGEPREIRIPETIDNKPVVGVVLRSPIKELVVPDTVKKLVFNKGTVRYVNYPVDLQPALGREDGYDEMGYEGDTPFDESYVETIYISKGVKEIPERMFYRCEILKGVFIPSSVTVISDKAFYRCKSLTDIVLSDGVTVIGEEAFADCYSLLNVTVPSTVKECGLYAFNSDSTDVSISYRGKVYTDDNIGEFYYNIRKNGKSFAELAQETTVTEAVVNSDDVLLTTTGTYIPDETASQDYTITTTAETTAAASTTGTAAMTTTAADSTTGTDAMTTTAADTTTSTAEVETTADTTSIPEDSSAYTEFRELSMWDVLPEIEETDINDLVFHYDENLKGAVVDGYTGSSDKVRIPEMVWDDGVGEYIVVAVDLSESEITELILPDTLKKLSYNKSTVKYINYPCYLETETVSYHSYETGIHTYKTTDTFNNSAVETVYIPEGVKELPCDTFASCSSLKTVYISNSVIEIGGSAFSECTALEKIVIPDSVVEMGTNTFYNCTSLKSVTISKSVSKIDAFSGCTSLTSVIIPDSVTVIGSSAFPNCTSLTSIKLPSSVTEIESGGYASGYGAFYGCTSLESIEIPDSVKILGAAAFMECTSLKSVVLPDSITELYAATFSFCTSLTEIIVPNSVTSIVFSDSLPGTFRECTSLTYLSLPDSLTSLYEYALWGCESIIVEFKGNTYDYEHLNDLYEAIMMNQ